MPAFPPRQLPLPPIQQRGDPRDGRLLGISVGVGSLGADGVAGEIALVELQAAGEAGERGIDGEAGLR